MSPVGSRPSGPESGASLVETLVVAAIGMVLLGSAIAWTGGAADTVQADANLRVVLGQLTVARETAINQRRAVEVRFLGTNTVQIVRHDLPAGETALSSATLEHQATFLRFAGVPDTPDGFGGTTALAFGGADAVMFTADGLLTDGSGNPVNGTVYLGRTGKPTTARALTIFGMTARIRTYRWNGSTWGQ